MEIDWYVRLIILLGLLIFSAFFSGSEVALFSLDKRKVRTLSEQKKLLPELSINKGKVKEEQRNNLILDCGFSHRDKRIAD